MRAIVASAVMSATVLASQPAMAETCSAAQADAAQAEVAHLETWPQMYGFYRGNRACDDGAIADGVTEATTRLLADHWADAAKLETLSANDAGFRRFVLSHIDETASTDRLQKARSNAVQHCRRDMGRLCRDIVKAATHALGG